MPTSKQGKFAHDVKHALLNHPKYTYIADVARAIGRRRGTVSRAIHGQRFPRVIKEICAELGLPLP